MTPRYNLIPTSGELMKRHSRATYWSLALICSLYTVLLLLTPPLGTANTFSMFDGVNISGELGLNIKIFQVLALSLGLLVVALQAICDAVSGTFNAEFRQNFLSNGSGWWLFSFIACAVLTASALVFMSHLWTFDPASARDSLLSTRLGALVVFLGLWHLLRLSLLHFTWSIFYLLKI